MLPKSIVREFDVFFHPAAPCRDLAAEYVEALWKKDRTNALRLVLDAVEAGTLISDVYLRVFQPTLYLVGRLWQIQILSVAQEHLFTAITQNAMAQLYPYIMSGSRNDWRLTATCVDSELHEVGIRMVADLFELEGWRTHFLGANTPSEALLDILDETRPHVVALSVTMSFHLGKAEKLITAIRDAGIPGMKIMVGGYAFNSTEDAWKQVGADGYASDGAVALNKAMELVTD